MQLLEAGQRGVEAQLEQIDRGDDRAAARGEVAELAPHARGERGAGELGGERGLAAHDLELGEIELRAQGAELVAALATRAHDVLEQRGGGGAVAAAARDERARREDLVGHRDRVEIAGGGIGGVERGRGLDEPALAGEADRAARVDDRRQLARLEAHRHALARAVGARERRAHRGDAALVLVEPRGREVDPRAGERLGRRHVAERRELRGGGVGLARRAARARRASRRRAGASLGSARPEQAGQRAARRGGIARGERRARRGGAARPRRARRSRARTPRCSGRRGPRSRSAARRARASARGRAARRRARPRRRLRGRRVVAGRAGGAADRRARRAAPRTRRRHRCARRARDPRAARRRRGRARPRRASATRPRARA